MDRKSSASFVPASTKAVIPFLRTLRKFSVRMRTARGVPENFDVIPKKNNQKFQNFVRNWPRTINWVTHFWGWGRRSIWVRPLLILYRLPKLKKQSEATENPLRVSYLRTSEPSIPNSKHCETFLSFVLRRLLNVYLRVVKTQIELQKWVFVVKRRAGVRWKALVL